MTVAKTIAVNSIIPLEHRHIKSPSSRYSLQPKGVNRGSAQNDKS